MKNNILNFLSQPYPFYYKGKSLWLTTGILFAMTLLFGYLFEPFNVYRPEHKMAFFWISFIHSCTPVVVIILFSLFKTNPKIEENWNLSKETLLIAVFLLLTGIFQFIIRDIIYNNPNNWSWAYLYEEVRNTFLVGMLFASILVPLNFKRLNTNHVNKANVLNYSQSLVKPIIDSSIIIEQQVIIDGLNLEVHNLLFAKSDGNYVELYLKQGRSKKELKRITLKQLELVLKPYSNIIKTHRSYLVNLNHIKNIKGNAQGYKIDLYHNDYKIPVSRNMINSFDDKISSI
ncbi:MAG: LytTR family transcriptional regulator [Flavobacteriaceae bacterium]|nr:LytTR family transcriptional regulator [Flavobacteriaceae bacterium]